MTFQMTQPFGGYSFGNHFIGDGEMGGWGEIFIRVSLLLPDP
ncbi:hypothetical protein [Fischerella thermalis]|nr:hypothetical protein [Fischerella thermalis]